MERRTVLKLGALASLSGLSGVAFSSKQSAPDIRIGVIGTGARGNGLASLIRGIDGLTVTAVCDTLPFRLKGAAEYVDPGTAQFADYRKVLDQKNVDAVIIATPFSTHAKIAEEALEAGKHIYCEKTLAKGVKAISSLKKKAMASGQIFQTGYQYRSVPTYQKVIEAIADGKVGQVTHIENFWNRNSDWRRPVPDPKLERLVNWRLYREYSGGLVAELCSHEIDFSNWLLKSAPEKVTGMGSINFWRDGRETYDNVQVFAEYPNGIIVEYKSRLSNASGGRSTRIYGNKGSIIIENNKAWFYKERLGRKAKQGIVDGVTGATVSEKWAKEAELLASVDSDPTAFALQEFRSCILENKQPVSNVESGARAAYVVDMAVNAMLDHKVKRWNNKKYGV